MSNYTNLPFKATNIEGVDRHDNILRLHKDSIVELSEGDITITTYELNEVLHNVTVLAPTIIKNETNRIHYIALTDNMISPPANGGPNEYISIRTRPQ